jgi:predicted DNA-binding protein (MmcQ/YjbR family)
VSGGESGGLARLRRICLALPEAYQQETWETETFRVRAKIFAMFVHERGARPAVWLKAPPGAQAILVGADAERFFAPPYVGPKGWVGIFLDRRPDWNEVALLVRRSYALVAPRKLVARMA